MAPGRTPQLIVERLNVEILKILDNPEVRERLTAMAADPIEIRTPEQFAAFAVSELELYTRLVKQSNAKPN